MIILHVRGYVLYAFQPFIGAFRGLEHKEFKEDKDSTYQNLPF